MLQSAPPIDGHNHGFAVAMRRTEVSSAGDSNGHTVTVPLLVDSPSAQPWRLAMIVTPYSRGAASPFEIASAAARYGGVIFVVDTSDPRAMEAWDVLCAAGRVIGYSGHSEADTSDLSERVRAALPGSSPDGLVTFSDTTIVTASRLAAALNVPYHSLQTANFLTDKLAQRRALNAVGCSVAAVELFDRTSGSKVQDLLLPCVVKPLHGAGSVYTYVLREPSDVDQCMASLPADVEFIVESFIAGRPPPGLSWLGPMISVETASTGPGVRARILGITGRLPLAAPAREGGAIFPLSLDPSLNEEVSALAGAALKAVGLNHGLAHIEIMLTQHGPQVIEVNGRLGGKIRTLMIESGYVDPVQTAVDLACGLAPVPDAVPATNGVVCAYWQQPPKAAQSVEWLPETGVVLQFPGVFRAKRVLGSGDRTDWTTGTASMAYEVWIRSADLTELCSRVAAVDLYLQEATRWQFD